MSFEGINFPVYRKYKNSKSYFKFLSPVQFEEIKVIGSRFALSLITAQVFPEKNFIRDLVLSYEVMADAIDADEYEHVASKARLQAENPSGIA
jgi:hypothetical protein